MSEGATHASAVKADFGAAAGWFAHLVAKVDPDQWDQPGLGEWDVRSLVGHASRALSTAEAYLPQPADHEDIASAAAYIAAAGTVDSSAIAERGREAGRTLGADPATAVRDLAERVTALVAATPGDALLTTVAGGMRLDAYRHAHPRADSARHRPDASDRVGRRPSARAT